MSSEANPPAATASSATKIECNVCTIGTHISRAFMCQLDLAKPTRKESTVLYEKKVLLDSLQSYHVWRRSCLMLAIPFMTVGMIFGIMDLVTTFADEDLQSIFNGFGNLLSIITNVDSVFLLVGIICSFASWSQLLKSIRILRYAFFISSIMPLIPALFPIEMSLNRATNYEIDMDPELQDYLFLAKLELSLGYMLTLLPVVISFAGGALRASIRIRWFLPESMLSGWILVMTAPFYSLLICITLIVALQVAGDFLLFFGTLWVVSAPWVYVIWGHLFVRLWTEEDKKRALLFQRVSGIISIVGYIIILIFSLTGDVSGVRFVGNSNDANSDLAYLVSYSQAIRIVIETFGRLVTTTICFCDAILRMNLESWSAHETSKLNDKEDINQRYQILMAVFQGDGSTGNSNSETETGPTEPEPKELNQTNPNTANQMASTKVQPQTASTNVTQTAPRRSRQADPPALKQMDESVVKQ